MISVAAELTGVHPQTLRIYERKELICPQRSSGNTRLYSQSDIDRLLFIQRLTQEEGINLAGVTRIIDMQRQIEKLRAELDRAHRHIAEVERRAESLSREQRSMTALVHVRRGPVVRRED